MPKLRQATSGAPIVGNNNRDVLFWIEASRTWEPDGIESADAAVLRATWAFQTSVIFTDNASTGGLQADGGDTFADVELGDTLFVPPILALGPPFHAGPAAPQFGGLYLVTGLVDSTNIVVTRDPRMATQAQIDAIVLVSAIDGDAAGFFQIATPAGAVLDTDAQVMPMIGKPALSTGDTFALQCTSGLLAWVAVTP
jgi:hypothetical protein